MPSEGRGPLLRGSLHAAAVVWHELVECQSSFGGANLVKLAWQQPRPRLARPQFLPAPPLNGASTLSELIRRMKMFPVSRTLRFILLLLSPTVLATRNFCQRSCRHIKGAHSGDFLAFFWGYRAIISVGFLKESPERFARGSRTLPSSQESKLPLLTNKFFYGQVSNCFFFAIRDISCVKYVTLQEILICGRFSQS